MKKLLTGLLLIAVILLSGCVSTVKPVQPNDVIVTIAPITLKEFQATDVSISVENNGTEPIESVSVSSFLPFKVSGGSNPNIPARTKEGSSSVAISASIEASGFKTVSATTDMLITYASGKDEKGNLIITTKKVPVQTIVLPDAKLQFVGFVKGIQNISEAEVTTWEISKGENATITFSVLNDGQTTIDGKTMSVFIDVVEKTIGTHKTLVINESIARSGTSHTKGVLLPILENAPNGETDVYVKLFVGDKELDSKKLLLKVRL